MEAEVGDDRSGDQGDGGLLRWRLPRGGPGEDGVDDAVGCAGFEDVEEVLPQVCRVLVRRAVGALGQRR